MDWSIIPNHGVFFLYEKMSRLSETNCGSFSEQVKYVNIVLFLHKIIRKQNKENNNLTIKSASFGTLLILEIFVICNSGCKDENIYKYSKFVLYVLGVPNNLS